MPRIEACLNCRCKTPLAYWHEHDGLCERCVGKGIKPSLEKVERVEEWPAPPEEIMKPPIGIEPHCIWQETRMLELSKVIQRYMLAGLYTGVVLGWVRELKRLLTNYEGPEPENINR